MTNRQRSARLQSRIARASGRASRRLSRRNFLRFGSGAAMLPSRLRGCFQNSQGNPISDTEGPPESNPTIADYLMRRLAALGIRHVFRVPGDYAFPIDEAVERCNDLTWVGCSNELNAAYSADGYARVRGAAILCTTYNIGSAAALAGVMGSKAERVPVFHVVGSPAHASSARAPMHHTYGDGDYEQFCRYHEVSVCASAYLTPQYAIAEIERVIAEALSQRMPVYLQVPEDYAMMPVVGRPVDGVLLKEPPPSPVTRRSWMPP